VLKEVKGKFLLSYNKMDPVSRTFKKKRLKDYPHVINVM
jgi:hypothetical protein